MSRERAADRCPQLQLPTVPDSPACKKGCLKDGASTMQPANLIGSDYEAQHPNDEHNEAHGGQPHKHALHGTHEMHQLGTASAFEAGESLWTAGPRTRGVETDGPCPANWTGADHRGDSDLPTLLGTRSVFGATRANNSELASSLMGSISGPPTSAPLSQEADDPCPAMGGWWPRGEARTTDIAGPSISTCRCECGQFETNFNLTAQR